jgi:hypothetical protein
MPWSTISKTPEMERICTIASTQSVSSSQPINGVCVITRLNHIGSAGAIDDIGARATADIIKANDCVRFGKKFCRRLSCKAVMFLCVKIDQE